ncbi:unnamed protein product [Sphagnum troendelagicum]|uniref:Uncharacterized protein n=1 Tax=Sphagnum troendelagicum TaxID=128251 RepID=A0ABP0U2M1_9BRYO
MTGQTDTMVSDSDIDANDDCEGGLQLVEPIDDEPEFGNTELENLVHQMNRGDSHNNCKEQLALSDNRKMNAMWEEICQKIWVDHNLDEEKRQQFWKVLGRY